VVHAKVVGESNSLLSSSSTIRLVKEHPQAFRLLGTPGSLGTVARDVLTLSADERAYIDAIPPTLQEAMRSAIYSSVDQGKPVQLSYAPAYDFEVHIWDYGEALSIQVRGPYESRSPQKAYSAKRGRAGRKAKSKPTRRRAKAKSSSRRRAG